MTLDADQIIRALAKLAAPIDSEYSDCALCGGEVHHWHDDARTALDIHTEDCPWRLAREYVAQLEPEEQR